MSVQLLLFSHALFCILLSHFPLNFERDPFAEVLEIPKFGNFSECKPLHKIRMFPNHFHFINFVFAKLRLCSI